MLLTTGRWIQNTSLQNASENDLLLNGPFYSGPGDCGSFSTLHAPSTWPQFLSRLVLLNLNPNSKKSKFITIILKSESNWTPTDVQHDVITFLGLRYPTVETRQFYHQQQVFSSGNPHLRKNIKRKPHQPATSNKKILNNLCFGFAWAYLGLSLQKKNCVSLRGEWASIDRDFMCDKVTMGEGGWGMSEDYLWD